MSTDKHLTIPGALEWDSGSVERFTIATLRYAGGSEHDVRYVSELDYDAALAREAALREELDRTKKAYEAYGIDFDRSEEKAEALQQRLTVAEQRLAQVEGACGLAMSAIDDDERGENFVKIIQAIKDKAALKPTEEVRS